MTRASLRFGLRGPPLLVEPPGADAGEDDEERDEVDQLERVPDATPLHDVNTHHPESVSTEFHTSAPPNVAARNGAKGRAGWVGRLALAAKYSLVQHAPKIYLHPSGS